MDERFEAKYHALEGDNWWFRARRDMILRLLRGVDPAAAVLEVGCSSGVLLEALAARGFRNVQGIDVSKRAVLGCRQRGLGQTAVMDAGAPAFRDASFDVVIASDVLEHIRDDALALTEWSRILRPGGRLIAFVPAFGFLWSGHDEVNHHFRRYTRRELGYALEVAGFRVERLSHWNVALFFPTAVVRLAGRLRRRRREGQLYELPAALNGPLTRLVRFENALLSSVDAPLGVSVFAVAAKDA